jgi:hypothetical protein
VFEEDRLEAAATVDVAELDTGDVIRDGPLSIGHGGDLGGRHVEELGFRVDEALDQPGTCNTVDAGVLSGNPPHFDFLLSLKCRHA